MQEKKGFKMALLSLFGLVLIFLIAFIGYFSFYEAKFGGGKSVELQYDLLEKKNEAITYKLKTENYNITYSKNDKDISAVITNREDKPHYELALIYNNGTIKYNETKDGVNRSDTLNDRSLKDFEGGFIEASIKGFSDFRIIRTGFEYFPFFTSPRVRVDLKPFTDNMLTIKIPFMDMTLNFKDVEAHYFYSDNKISNIEISYDLSYDNSQRLSGEIY